MKYLLIIALLILASFNAFSQNTQPCTCDLTGDSVFSPKLIGSYYHPLPGVVGDEFFNKAPVKGNIVLTSGDTAKNISIRYNGRIDGLLYWPSNSSSEILLDKSSIEKFNLEYPSEKSISVFQKIKVAVPLSSDSSEIFCQQLYINKLSVFAFRQYAGIQNISELMEGKMISKKIYELSTSYYFKLPNGKTTTGFKRLNRKSLQSIFPKDPELIKSVLKKLHQRRFSTEDDFIKLATTLNQTLGIFN